MDSRAQIEWECARLINHYANLNDAGKWEEVAALFTEDGLMTRPTAPDARIVGRDTILQSFTSRPARVTRHFCANIVVTVESETEASAYSNIMLFVAGPDGKEGPPLIGDYRDRFRKTADGWRFSERRGALAFR